MVERDAALAGGGTTHPLKLPSGAGAPPGGNKTPREELADGGPPDGRLPEARPGAVKDAATARR